MTAVLKTVARESNAELIKLGVGLAVVSVGSTWSLSGLLAVLLPAKVALISTDAERAGTLALIVTIASIAALFSSVLSGGFSDRTRSRWGKRTPWLIATGLGCAISFVILTSASGVPMLIVGTTLALAFVNAQLVITSAIIPDRVPQAQRGTLAACIGVGQLIGLGLGLVVGGRFVSAPDVGLVWIAGVSFATGIFYKILVSEPSNRSEPRMASSGLAMLRSFLPPAHARDFYWAVAQRFFLVFGTQMLLAYQLYIIIDHLRQDTDGTAAALSQAAVAYAVGALLGGVLGGPISDRFKRRKTLIMISVFLIGGSILLLAAFPHVWSFTLYKVFNGFGFGIYLAVHAALTSEVLPNPETRGKDMGFLNVANGLGTALAPSISALALGLGLGYNPLFFIASAVCIGSIFMIAPIRSVR